MMSKPECEKNKKYDVVSVDVTNYPALIKMIDEKYGEEWWDRLIKDPLFRKDKRGGRNSKVE